MFIKTYDQQFGFHSRHRKDIRNAMDLQICVSSLIHAFHTIVDHNILRKILIAIEYEGLLITGLNPSKQNAVKVN